jgi:hypothetical protein
MRLAMETYKEEMAFVVPADELASALTAALVVARRIDGVNSICTSRLYGAMTAINYGVAVYTIIYIL